jgi:hypothetical protein
MMDLELFQHAEQMKNEQQDLVTVQSSSIADYFRSPQVLDSIFESFRVTIKS